MLDAAPEDCPAPATRQAARPAGGARGVTTEQARGQVLCVEGAWHPAGQGVSVPREGQLGAQARPQGAGWTVPAGARPHWSCLLGEEPVGLSALSLGNLGPEYMGLSGHRP